jgi:hypothetical protein
MLTNPGLLQRRPLLAGMVAWAAGVGFVSLPLRAHAHDDGDEVYRQWRAGRPQKMEFDGRGLQVVFEGDASAATTREAWVWIRRAADATGRYFGRFPVDRVALLVRWRDGAGVGHGTSWGYDGSMVRVVVGRETTAEAFAADWVLVHELVHAALPTLSRRHVWLMEGAATYVEPVARAMAGQRDAASLWNEFMSGMPKGLPEPDDEGLDRTHTWGRTYWGGALFHLAVDVDMRVATGNRKGLQDALIAINRASGGNVQRWGIERYLSVGDGASGTEALARRYASMANAPDGPDIAELWRQLGVIDEGGRVRLDDAANWAGARRAILAPGGGT